MPFKRRGSTGHDKGIPMPNVLLSSANKEQDKPDMPESRVTTRMQMLPKSTARKSAQGGKKLEAEKLLGTLSEEERQKLKESMQGGQKGRSAPNKNIFSILNESKDSTKDSQSRDKDESEVVVIEYEDTDVEQKAMGSKPVRTGVFSNLSKSLKALNSNAATGRKSRGQSPIGSTTSEQRSWTQSPVGSTTSELSLVSADVSNDAQGQRLESGKDTVKYSGGTRQPKSKPRRGEFSELDFDLILPSRSRSQRSVMSVSLSGHRETSAMDSGNSRSKTGANNSNENIYQSQRTGLRSRRSSPASLPSVSKSNTSTPLAAPNSKQKPNITSTNDKIDADKHQTKSGSKAAGTSSVDSTSGKIKLKIPECSNTIMTTKDQTFLESSFDSERHKLSSPDSCFDDSPVTRLRRFDFSPRSHGFYKAIAQGLKPKKLTAIPSDTKSQGSDAEKSFSLSPRTSPRARRYSYDSSLSPTWRDETDSGGKTSRSTTRAAQGSDNSSPSRQKNLTETPPQQIFDSYDSPGSACSDSSVKVHPNVKSLLKHLEESKTKQKVPVICLENITNSPTSGDQEAKLVNADLEKEFAASVPTEAKRKLTFSPFVDLENDSLVTAASVPDYRDAAKCKLAFVSSDAAEESNDDDKDKSTSKPDGVNARPNIENSAMETEEVCIPIETGDNNRDRSSSGGSQPMQGISTKDDANKDGANDKAGDRYLPSPCKTEPVKHGLLFGLIEKMQTRIPTDNDTVPPEPEDEESSEQASVREESETSGSSEETSGQDSSDEESEAVGTPVKDGEDSDSDSGSESDSDEDSESSSSDDEEDAEANGVVASTSKDHDYARFEEELEDESVASHKENLEEKDDELVSDKPKPGSTENQAVDGGRYDQEMVKAVKKETSELNCITDEPKIVPGQIPTLAALAGAVKDQNEETNYIDKTTDEMHTSSCEKKEFNEKDKKVSIANEKGDDLLENTSEKTGTIDLLKMLGDDESSRSSGSGTPSPKLIGKLPISVEDKLHVVSASVSDQEHDWKMADAKGSAVETKEDGSELFAYLTDPMKLTKSLADIHTSSKENTPELVKMVELEGTSDAASKDSKEAVSMGREKVIDFTSEEDRLAMSLPFKMFEKSDPSTNNSNAFISTELESYLDTKADLQSEILQCDKRLTNSDKPMKYTFGRDIHIDENAVCPDLDSIDGILFMSFDSEESLEAHTIVETNKKICSWHSSFYHRMKYVLSEQARRRAKIGDDMVRTQVAKKWKPMSERMAKYRRILANQVMKIKKRNMIKKMKEEAQKDKEAVQEANDMALIRGMATGDFDQIDPDADVGSAYLHRTGKLHWRTQERLLKNLTPEEAKELQSELGLTLKKKRRKLVPFTRKKNTSDKHSTGSDHSMSPEERPSAAGSFDQLYQTFGANDADGQDKPTEEGETMDGQGRDDDVTELLDENRHSDDSQSRYKHPLMRSRSIFETFDMERPKIPSPVKPRYLMSGSKSSFGMFKCDIQGLMKRRLDFAKKMKREDPLKGRKNLTKLTITGKSITDIDRAPTEESADDDCIITSEYVSSTLDNGQLRPQMINQRMAQFAASAVRLVKAVQKKGKTVYELEEPPHISYLTQHRALACALQGKPPGGDKAEKGPCDKPGK
jgi:hypothetical protein